MDGRRAAVNVLVGAGIGASVPIIAAVALVFSVEHFHPVDHVGTLIVLSTICAAIGVAVNLPWNFDATPASNARARPNPSANPSDDFAARAKRYEFDAGFDAQDTNADTDAGADANHRAKHRAKQESAGGNTSNHQRRFAGGRGPRRSFSMSHRRALEILGFDPAADPHPDLDALRAAYRNLAKQLHPDQFASQGDDAVAEATEKFRQLQEAYDLARAEACAATM